VASSTGGTENVGRENDGHEIDGPICSACYITQHTVRLTVYNVWVSGCKNLQLCLQCWCDDDDDELISVIVA